MSRLLKTLNTHAGDHIGIKIRLPILCVGLP